jgi:hypothetical protein
MDDEFRTQLLLAKLPTRPDAASALNTAPGAPTMGTAEVVESYVQAYIQTWVVPASTLAVEGGVDCPPPHLEALMEELAALGVEPPVGSHHLRTCTHRPRTPRAMRMVLQALNTNPTPVIADHLVRAAMSREYEVAASPEGWGCSFAANEDALPFLAWLLLRSVGVPSEAMPPILHQANNKELRACFKATAARFKWRCVS